MSGPGRDPPRVPPPDQVRISVPAVLALVLGAVLLTLAAVWWLVR